MPAPRWKIGKLKAKMPLHEASDRIMRVRVRELRGLIVAYLENQTPENLHQIRIAIRRLRYSMELFIGLYNKKTFRGLYKRIEYLQNLTGTVRDAYIFQEKLRQIKDMTAGDNQALTNANIIAPPPLEQLNKELSDFNRSDELKKFAASVKQRNK